MNIDWIIPVLNLYPDAAKEKDYDGKYPLHLARQHGAPLEIIDALLEIYPQAGEKRDNLGRTPKQVADQSEKSAFTPANDALMLVDGPDTANNSNNKNYPDNAVVVCRGNALVRDLPLRLQEDTDALQSYLLNVYTL